MLSAAVRDLHLNYPGVYVTDVRTNCPQIWEAYPHHQYIHANGALRCCEQGGCWKSRSIPLGDGDIKDLPENLCEDVVGTLPRCMDMITAEDVIDRMKLYFNGGAIHYLSFKERSAVETYLNDVRGAQVASNF